MNSVDSRLVRWYSTTKVLFDLVCREDCAQTCMFEMETNPLLGGVDLRIYQWLTQNSSVLSQRKIYYAVWDFEYEDFSCGV